MIVWVMIKYIFFLKRSSFTNNFRVLCQILFFMLNKDLKKERKKYNVHFLWIDSILQILRIERFLNLFYFSNSKQIIEFLFSWNLIKKKFSVTNSIEILPSSNHVFFLFIKKNQYSFFSEIQFNINKVSPAVTQHFTIVFLNYNFISTIQE